MYFYVWICLKYNRELMLGRSPAKQTGFGKILHNI